MYQKVSQVFLQMNKQNSLTPLQRLSKFQKNMKMAKNMVLIMDSGKRI